MFNVQGQMNKQMMAAAVIFSMMQFSMVGLALGNTESQSFSILTLVYSFIALFSFFNVSYVRDFDAL